MARIKYYYDTEKCKYERVKVKPSEVILNLLGFLSMTVIFAIVLLIGYTRYWPTPREVAQQGKIEDLSHMASQRDEEINLIKKELIDLKTREQDVYRVIVGADSLPSFIQDPYTQNFAYYDVNLNIDKVLDVKMKQLDVLHANIGRQNDAYNVLLQEAQNKEKWAASIPAIQPIRNKQLRRLASGYGWRMHPILGVRKFHDGVDFSADRGTPIFSTGDGVVVATHSSYGGYGKQIVVDHGFGYKTRFAHLDKIEVKIGQKVKRGEKMGEVGNTGRSTAPHLHYEVIKDNRNINPVHFFFKDLNAKEYEEILKIASIENQSLS